MCKQTVLTPLLFITAGLFMIFMIFVEMKWLEHKESVIRASFYGLYAATFIFFGICIAYGNYKLFKIEQTNEAQDGVKNSGDFIV